MNEQVNILKAFAEHIISWTTKSLITYKLELLLIPAASYSIALPNLEGNVQLENLSIQNEWEIHHQIFHTWPSEPAQFLQTKQAAK